MMLRFQGFAMTTREVVYMLWFNFILDLNFISFCLKLIIILYHSPKTRKIKFKTRIKLNYNIFFVLHIMSFHLHITC